MNTASAVAIGIAVVVVLAALAFITLARRSDVRGAGELSSETIKRDRSQQKRQQSVAAKVEAAASKRASSGAVALAGGGAVAGATAGGGLAPWIPPDRDEIDTTRREFFNRAIVSLMGLGLGTFAAAAFVAYLWPTKTGGFGGKVPVGKIDDVRAGIASGNGFMYASEALSWITEYPAEALAKGEELYPDSLKPGLQAGLIASWQKCPHLGCRVPECSSSQWFECGCHGSQYNRVGEKKAGPAPRGLDHFPIEVTGSGDVIIDTGTVVTGMVQGTNTTGQEAEGPHCVGEGGGH